MKSKNESKNSKKVHLNHNFAYDYSDRISTSFRLLNKTKNLAVLMLQTKGKTVLYHKCYFSSQACLEERILLSKSDNLSNIIKLIAGKIVEAGCQVQEAKGDADASIAKTAVSDPHLHIGNEIGS